MAEPVWLHKKQCKFDLKFNFYPYSRTSSGLMRKFNSTTFVNEGYFTRIVN